MAANLSLKETTEYAQARFLSGLLLCLSLILTSGAVLIPWIRPASESTHAGLLAVSATAGTLFLLYLLSRTRHARLTAFLYWTITFVSICIGALLNKDPAYTQISISFFTVTIVAGATVLPPKRQLNQLTFALYLVIFGGIILYRDDLTDGQRLDSGMLLLTVWIVTFFNVRMRDSVHKIILDQQAQMATFAKFAALGEMASSLAHEVNNPLAVINGQAEIIRMSATKNDLNPEALLERAEKISTMVHRISKIIKGLRAFAQIDVNAPPQSNPVRKLIEETALFSAERLKNRMIRFEYDLERIPETWMIRCRHEQIVQALVSLVANAAEAIKGQQGSWVRIEIERTQEKVTIRVIDSGMGIPNELREKIFHPFFSTKEVGQGTGLGLSIARGIAQSHDGELFVDSTHSNTCFVMVLPS